MSFLNKVGQFFKECGSFLKKRALFLLTISLLVCFISGLGASLVQSNGFSVEVMNITETLDLVEVSGTVDFSLQIYKPKNATKNNPAPLIVASHGYMNTKEMQAPIAMELARRGFVVIAPDWVNHGHTDVSSSLPIFATSGGVIAIVEYGAKLEYVDETRIGLTGHSLGGDNSSFTAEYYGNKGREAAAEYLASEGVTVSTASVAQLAEARKRDDEANKILSVLPVASQPFSIFTGVMKFVGTKTHFGVVVTLYDETSWGQAGKYTGYNQQLVPPDLVGKLQTKQEWTGSQFLESPRAAAFIQSVYPAFPTTPRHTVPIVGEPGYDASLPDPAMNPIINLADSPVKANTYYTSSGIVSPTAQNPVDEPSRVIYPTKLAHAAAFYNVKSIGYIADFFYSTLGVAEGAKVLASGNQTWFLKESFTLIGLAGIIMFVIAFAGLILRIPFFEKIKQRTVVLEDGTVVSKLLTREDLDKDLPELKGWKRHLPFWLTMSVSTLISGFTLRYFTGNISGHGWGNELFPASPYFPQAFNNAIIVWALMSGLIAMALFGIQWLFVGRKAGEKPFGKVATGGFLRSFIASVVVIGVAYLILTINQSVFGTDYRWYILSFKTIDRSLVMTMVRYSLLFGLFYAMNTFININQRFKNVSEWKSTLITALFNVLGLGIVFMIQYFTAYLTGGIYYWSSNLINYSPLVIILPIASIIERRLYLKSGNIWFAALITSMLFTIMIVATINQASYIFW